jgi:DNA-binding NarL/FixJ family response regulator
MNTGDHMKVLIVDDSAIIRERLINMLSNLNEVEIVGEVDDAPDALAAVRALKPEAVILDIQMPGGSGIDVLRDIKRERLAPTVIMLTNFPHPQFRHTCLEARADFFFDKTTEFEKVMDVFQGLTTSHNRAE